MSQDTRSPENLYLIGTLLLFIILPFQNCTVSPVDIQFTSAWAEQDPGYRFETRSAATSPSDPQADHVVGPSHAHLTP